MKELLARLLSPAPLKGAQVDGLMDLLCDEEIGNEPKAYAIGTVMMRGITNVFLADAANYLLQHAATFTADDPNAIDLCGTGGDTGADQIKTFNISTAAAFIVAASGVGVVKHGNRAVSSLSGSSDVLEALSVPISYAPDQAKTRFAKHGICFVSAPHFHPALKYVGPVRRALGIPTFFNLLGPLVNPANVRRQLIGVFSSSHAERMAEAARLMGKVNVMTVHSDDGLDEISLSAPTHIYHLKDGGIDRSHIKPEDFGLTLAPREAVAGGDATENARIITRIFEGEKGAKADIVCLNAAAALVVADHVPTIADGIEVARTIITSGKALAKLNETKNT